MLMWQVGWLLQKVFTHTVKVNVDGSFRSSSGMAACGGLIYDSHGVLITGFSCNLGACTSVWAEAWSLYLGMKLARTLGFSTVVFEMDSQTIVNCVNLRRFVNAFLSPIFQEIWHLLSSPDWDVRVVHIFQEANRVADFSANLGHDGPFHCVTLG